MPSFAARPRDRPRARMAGTMVCEGGEPAFWPHSDYSQVYTRFLTCTRTAGTKDLHGRTCSRTHRLSCVPEGASFFLAAATAGARASLKTIERYAFLKVRRVGAPVAGGRKALIFHGFAIPLENMKANEAFGAFARWSLLLERLREFFK